MHLLCVMIYVYYIWIGRRVVYVGRTSNIIQRSNHHFSRAVGGRPNKDRLYLHMNNAIARGVVPKFTIEYFGDAYSSSKEEHKLIYANHKSALNAPLSNSTTKKYGQDHEIKPVRIVAELRRYAKATMDKHLMKQLRNIPKAIVISDVEFEHGNG